MQKFLKFDRLLWKQKWIRSFLSSERFLRKVNNLTLALVLGLASACSSLPHNFSKEESGTWSAKALVQDLKAHKSFIVNVDIFAVKNKGFRLDVNTSFAIHLASMTYFKENVEILLPQQRKFYFGKSSPGAFRKILPLEFDPMWLNAILFDLKFDSEVWKCTQDKFNQLQKCESTDVKVEWLKRQSEMRVVRIETKTAILQLQLKGFDSEPVPEEKFTIGEPPNTFRKIRL